MSTVDLRCAGVRTQRDRDRFRVRYRELSDGLHASVIIPGLDDGWVPQGIAWISHDCIAVGLHHERKALPSRVAVMELGSTAMARTHPLAEVDGTPYVGHAGGVAVHGGALWISSGRKLRGLPLEMLLRARGGEALRFDRAFGVHARGSFTCADGERLWVGEFTWNGAYRPFAHEPCPGTPRRGAWVAAYRVLNGRVPPTRSYVVEGERVHAPEAVVFIPDGVQGMVRIDGMMVLHARSLYGR